MLINSLFPTQVTKNFNTQEVINASRFTGTTFEIDNRLIPIAQYLRDRLGVPITINSAYRDEAGNKEVGGVKNSQHLHGNAFDLSGKGLVSFITHAFENKTSDWYHLVTLGVNGLGLYDTFVHFDVRDGGFAYWNKKKLYNPLYWIVGVVAVISLYLKSVFE